MPESTSSLGRARLSREHATALLGEPPATRPPLDVEVLSEVEHEGHTLKRIVYAAVPGERVQAYLLLSRGNEGQNPGVLAIHQDGAERPYRFGGSEPAGVAGDPELPYGRELCQRATSSSVSSRTPRPTSSAPI